MVFTGPAPEFRQKPLLQIAARVPSAACSPAVDFLIPGLEGLHFVAYGTSSGGVVVACARQVNHIGRTCQEDKTEQQQLLQTVLVLDLQHPTATATAVRAAHGGGGTNNTTNLPPGASVAVLAPAPAAVLGEPVLHVAFGGGPHLLLAACTKDTLAVVSLEGLAAHLFHQQTCGGSRPSSAEQHTLWHQLAAVHCGHAEVLAISWTQQLDGILTSSSDGMLAMWHLRPLVELLPPWQHEQLRVPLPPAMSGARSAAEAVLGSAWSVHTPTPQRLVCAGVSVYAPSATAAGCRAPAGPSCSNINLVQHAQSSDSSPTKESREGERYASIWWPQLLEQRQRHYAAGRPSVGQEKLRHPAAVIGLQWSPGVLQKDALSFAADCSGSNASAAFAGASEGASSTSATIATTEAEDHPALMTLAEDGTVRVWVETLVLTESRSSPQPALRTTEAGSPHHAPVTASLQLQRLPSRSPGSSSKCAIHSGAGSPGAAPSSPRDVRAAAAAAAALGAAAPAITSYFCMALLLDPSTTAGGPAKAAAAGAAASKPSTTGTQQGHVALWARHAGPLLLHKQQRRIAAPVLWLFTGTVNGHSKVLLHLHAVRGLSAIVMSAGYGGSLSCTSGGSSSTRPAAVLWGQHSWELPSIADDGLAQLLQRLCCWVSDEEGFPLLHVFTSSNIDESGHNGRLLLAGRTLSTVQEDGSMSMQVHKQLAVVSTWQAAAVAHVRPITAFAASAAGDCATLVASCDSSGKLLLWRGPNLQHLAVVPAAAVGGTAALAWLQLEAATMVADDGILQRWLAVGSGSMVQCYAVGNKQAVAMATAALPAGCSGIKSLHALTSACRGNSGSSCLLVAVCSSSAGHGSMLCSWRCSAVAGSGNGCSMLLHLAGTAAVPAIATVVTVGATASSDQLLLGAADGTVVLLTIAAGGNGLDVRPFAAVQELGPVAAAAADEGCLHIATASGSGLTIWTPGNAMGSSSSAGAAFCRHYGKAAYLQMPRPWGNAAAVAWLRHSVVPCLAVGTSIGSILMLSMRRSGGGSSSWQWVACLPAPAAAGFGIKRLLVSSSCSSVITAVDSQLLQLSEYVQLPPHQRYCCNTVLLGRLLLESAGPLPQYHPRCLEALLRSGKHTAAAAVLQRLTSWLAALRQHAKTTAAAGTAGLHHPASLGVHVAVTTARSCHSNLPAPLFAELPLADVLNPQLLQLGSLLRHMSPAASFAAPEMAHSLSHQQQQAGGSTSLDSGLLDLAAFGMTPPSETVPTQQQLEMHMFGGLGKEDLYSSFQAPAAGPSQPTASKEQRAVLLSLAKQPLLPSKQLLPVAADCLQQLQDLLVGNHSDAASEAALQANSIWTDDDALHLASSSSEKQHFTQHIPLAAMPIPGLSLADTSAVLSIAGAFSVAAISDANVASSGTVDAAAAHFIAAVSLACSLTRCASCTNEQHSSNGNSWLRQQRLQQQRGTITKAAGAAHTLAPSAVVASYETNENISSNSSIGQKWGLLPGLDAMAVLWALLSGTEEQMLRQALCRLYQHDAASTAAAAAVESAETAVCLAVQSDSKLGRARDQLPTWAQLRELGAGFWLRDHQVLVSAVEQLAKQQFAARRNADDCALLYCAAGRRNVLQGLYRSTQNQKLADFLARDFGREQHRQAAQKNAFVLLGQHRHELAAAFFILGNCPDDAIGVAANEMRDPQLALVLCRVLFGSAGSEAELRLLRHLEQEAKLCASLDTAMAVAACHWLQGDAAAAVSLLLDTDQFKMASATVEHAAQVLPLLHWLLTLAPPVSHKQQEDWQQQLAKCLTALATTLRGGGLYALAVEAAAAAADVGGDRSEGKPVWQQHDALLLQQVLAVTLLPGVLEQQRHPNADAAHQLELLQQLGLPLNAPAIMSLLGSMRRPLVSAGQQHGIAWVPPAVGQADARPAMERQQSSGGSSYRSRDSEQPRWQQQRQGIANTEVVGEGQVLFRVDGDKLEAVACCPLMSPDVLGRPVVVASLRHGLVEGELHIVPPEPLFPDSPAATAGPFVEEEQLQRGGMFSRLLSQLFDQATWQTTWQQDGTWHHGTAEFDVVGAAADTPDSVSAPHGAVLASSISTGAMAAHPHKQLYLSGCGNGRLHLWQFGERHALATYTPVPGSELANISKAFSGLLSFSRSFKHLPVAPRLANWGRAAAVRFAPSGERFAAVGEGGVVATWRLDVPSRLVDGDGHGCAEWWHQALSKQGCAVDFVGGSSRVLVVGGRCISSSAASTGNSNLSVWDTMAPTATSCVGRLSHHQSTVTAVSMLPGGWLLAAGDGEGGLSCTDLRMMGGSSGPRLLWSVKASRGGVRAIVTMPCSSKVALGPSLDGGSVLLATAGADGAVRLWCGTDGRLLQSIEGAHYSSRPPSAGSRQLHDGGPPLTSSSGQLSPGAHPLPVTGLTVCEEGLVTCGADGCVRLFSFSF